MEWSLICITRSLFTEGGFIPVVPANVQWREGTFFPILIPGTGRLRHAEASVAWNWGDVGDGGRDQSGRLYHHRSHARLPMMTATQKELGDWFAANGNQ